MEIITYSLLNDNDRNSTEFYNVLSDVTDEITVLLNESDEKLLKSYIIYIETQKIEKLRDFREYFLDFITIGVFWKIYIKNADVFNSKFLFLFEKLYKLRKKYRKIKSEIDFFRGFFSWVLLRKKSNKSINEIGKENKNFKKLITWMKACKEFNGEVKRFEIWDKFFSEQNSDSVEKYLTMAVEISDKFEIICEKKLGKYSGNIDEFLENSKQRYKYKENYMFCQKIKIEYYLNMVGAELMNRSLREEFLKSKRKIVLLPACMKSENGKNCKCIREGNDIKCIGCNDSCNIKKIKTVGENNNFEVRVIPHSSDFGRWLKTWENSEEVGVVAVACVLNLLTGGYEMRSLNIRSQCVFLDYCGCKGHWHKTGIATNINIEEVLNKLTS